jgi:hypothetical protein
MVQRSTFGIDSNGRLRIISDSGETKTILRCALIDLLGAIETICGTTAELSTMRYEMTRAAMVSYVRSSQATW